MLALVDLLMTAKVGNNGKVAATSIHVTCVGLLASVAVHMSLERTRSRESLVANFALMLLLGVRGHLRTELTHHGLRCRRKVAAHEV